MSSEQRDHGRVFLAIPLILVNTAAIWGQAGWAYDNLHVAAGRAQVLVALLFALAVESVGVYLAFEAHAALMADQASGLLRLGSYGVGLLAGALNFQHFAPRGLATAVAFGVLSSISPWLWAVWSRARNRSRLAELDILDVRGVRLSTARKLWHPVRSMQVMSWAAWAGVTNPAEAVAGWETSRVPPSDAAGSGSPSPLPAPAATERPPVQGAGGEAVRSGVAPPAPGLTAPGPKPQALDPEWVAVTRELFPVGRVALREHLGKDVVTEHQAKKLVAQVKAERARNGHPVLEGTR